MEQRLRSPSVKAAPFWFFWARWKWSVRVMTLFLHQQTSFLSVREHLANKTFSQAQHPFLPSSVERWALCLKKVCGWVRGLQSFSEQKEFKKGKQQVPSRKCLSDNQELNPNTEQYYFSFSPSFPWTTWNKLCQLQPNNTTPTNDFHWAVTPRQAQTWGLKMH